MKKCILSLFLIFASLSLYAEPNQSLTLIKDKVEHYVLEGLADLHEGSVRISTGKLDARLTLKACDDSKIEVFNPYQVPMRNASTIGVKCMEEQNPWTIYVPIRIAVFKTVLVAKKGLLKGSPLTEQDIYPVEMDAQKLKQGYFTDPKQLIGLVCKKDITPDSLLNPYNVELAKLVQVGEQVAITVVNGGLKISMLGIAMNDGVLGQIIKVKNLTSKKIIEAQVSGKDKVQVVL